MYEIKVLSNDEFDEISKSDPRYAYVDDTNLGFSDREKGIAYVRGTHIHELNKYLINHELEELESDESIHEDPNGIRHKKGPKFFKDILFPALTGFLTGDVSGAIQGVMEGFQGFRNRVAQNSQPGGGRESSQTAFPNQEVSFGSKQTAFPQTVFPSQVPIEPRLPSIIPSQAPIEPRIPSTIALPLLEPPLSPRNSFFSPETSILGSPRTSGSAFSNFNVQGPSIQTGSSFGDIASILGGQNIQNNPFSKIGNINQDLQNRLKGFYSGRLAF